METTATKEATMKERTFRDPTHKYWTITARPVPGGWRLWAV